MSASSLVISSLFALAPRRRAFDLARNVNLDVFSACSASLSASASKDTQSISKRRRLQVN